jgi:hypothetical protein
MPLAWTEFILKEYNLEEDDKVAHFFIRMRKCICIRIASWHATSHPRKKTSAIWFHGEQSSLQVMKLQITSLGNDFAETLASIHFKTRPLCITGGKAQISWCKISFLISLLVVRLREFKPLIW